MSNIIQSLWIGNKLTKMEQLSIKSFLQNGYTYHLYTYNNVKNVPTGTIIKDGNEIISKHQIFTYQNGSYAAFSNLFRFTLLYQKGGYWADTDLICIKPFNFTREYVFVSEPSKDYKKSLPTSCLIKLPKKNKVSLRAVNLQKIDIIQILLKLI